VVHSAATRVTFDHVPHGSHVVVVLLVGSNDVSVNPPVAAMVTFMVRSAPRPTLPLGGNT